jgi:hypothetical protein
LSKAVLTTTTTAPGTACFHRIRHETVQPGVDVSLGRSGVLGWALMLPELARPEAPRRSASSASVARETGPADGGCGNRNDPGK